MGEWDLYITLSERHGWTPDQVDALDPDFLLEKLAFIRAEGDYEALLAARRKAQQQRGR